MSNKAREYFLKRLEDDQGFASSIHLEFGSRPALMIIIGEIMEDYHAEITGSQTLPLPAFSTAISAKEQNGKLVLWAIVEPGNIVRPKKVLIYGTGNKFNGLKIIGHRFIDTVIMSNSLVCHVFIED